nr:hypothetical protein [Tanacetum cinerariifolium]
MTAPSTSSTNDVNTANPAYEASTVSSNVNISSPQVSTANFSDNVISNRFKMAALSPKYEGKMNDSTVTRWDTLPENAEHKRTKMVRSKIKTTLGTATYKRGLATIEEQLVTYKKNEVLFSEEVVVLKREVACKNYKINVLKNEFEEVKQEKEGIEFKIENFDNASKSLDKLIGSQITNNNKKGLGYHAAPLPHLLIYNGPTKLDLSYSGLDEFKEPEFKGYSLRDKQVSKDTSSFVESPLNVDKETAFSIDNKIEFVKPKNHDKHVKKSVSGCSRHMTRNIAYLSDFKEFDGGYVTFGEGAHGGRISGSYEHYKGVGAEVELLEPGFELQGSKMVEMGQFG